MAGGDDGRATRLAALKRHFSLRAFLQGLAVTGLVYGLLAGWLWFNAGQLEESRRMRLASQTVLIERPSTLQTETVTETPRPPGDAATGTNSTAQTVALPAVDTEKLYEQTKAGPIPVRGPDGRSVFDAFRRPFDKDKAAGKPVISLTLVDLGLSDTAAETALRTMPPEISFAFSPYTAAPDYWVQESRKRGHEVWFTLPLESGSYPDDDTGPHTMLVGAPERENQEKLTWLMSRATGYAGFIATPDPVFLEAANDMRPVIGNVLNRGIGLVSASRAQSSSMVRSMALGLNASYANADIWLDEEPSKEAIQRGLEELEQTARDKGHAAGFFHPHPVSYQEIVRWLEKAPERGFIIAPLSAQTDF